MDTELSELFSTILNKGLFLCARNYVNIGKKIYFNLVIDLQFRKYY